MILTLEIVPLGLHLGIALQLRIALRPLVAKVVVHRDDVVKYQRHSALALILS